MIHRLLFIFLGFLYSGKAFSEGNSDVLKRIVDIEYIENSNKHIALPLRNVEVLSKAYSYVHDPENSLVKFDNDFYHTSLFVLKEGYVVTFVIPFKRGVLVEPWSKYYNHVSVYVDSTRSSVKLITSEEAVELTKELVDDQGAQ
ncbi:hypothetical protein R50073_45140 [Maricurvus nonylphenolicus]|uniref:hypothetical protein n=1 Tax=Maricurvus nonylphenolicus TaxID=1008307 RepID=UPI0036F271F0